MKKILPVLLSLSVILFFALQSFICGGGNPVPSGPKIIRTSTGLFDTIQVGTKSNLRAIHYGSHADGIIAGDNSTILLTKNAGLNWKSSDLKANCNLYGTYMIDAATGKYVVVGSEYSIYLTGDSGSTWKKVMNDPNGKLLRSVCFTGEKGFAVGDNGLILYSSNSGNAWNKIDAGTSNNLNSVYIGYDKPANIYTVWIVGDKGTFIKNVTKDPRDLKTVISSMFKSNDLFCVTAVPNTKNGLGFIGASGGTVYSTADTGAVWTSSNVAGTSSLFGVHFESHKLGYAVGENGVVLKFLNGNWTALPSPTAYNLNAVDPYQLSGSDLFYPTVTAVGDKGGVYIIRTSDSNIPGWDANLVLDPQKCQWVLSLTQVQGADNPITNYKNFEVWSSSIFNCKNAQPRSSSPVQGWQAEDTPLQPYLYRLRFLQPLSSYECGITADSRPGDVGSFDVYMIDGRGNPQFMKTFVIQY